MPFSDPPPLSQPPLFTGFAEDEATTEDESEGGALAEGEDEDGSDGPARKRVKRMHGGADAPVREQRLLKSLHRAVSPPARRVGAGESEAETEDEDDAEPRGRGARKVEDEAKSAAKEEQREALKVVEQAAALSGDGREQRPQKTKFISSPIQLTRIQDLPPAANLDTVTLKDILCDPLIVEVWQFNYLFDVDFLMNALDEDVRDTVRVKVVHGNWRREDQQRLLMERWAKAYPNLEVIQAYMPEPFGTHHSKMMVLIRADDLAQVVIHTANMIRKDWTNMTNAVWRSPLLPLLPESMQVSQPQYSQNATSSSSPGGIRSENHSIGSGKRFKTDLLRYLGAYGKRLHSLTEQLLRYDFSSIRAALVASTPHRVKLDDTKPEKQTSWGWVGLREVLHQIPVRASAKAATNEDELLVAQISSIATLDQTGAWLEHFESVLAARKSTAAVAAPSSSVSTNSEKTSGSSAFKPASQLPISSSTLKSAQKSYPPLKIIFPSVADVRTSLDGYYSGASIHLKTQSAKQQKQLGYMRPRFCRWNTAAAASTTTSSSASRAAPQNGCSALRSLAAPHIKTYVRYRYPSDQGLGGEGTCIEWAMLTSANLSTQAWGALPVVGKEGPGGAGDAGGAGGARARVKIQGESGKEVRVCSWEIGVVVWPELFVDSGEGEVVMVPVVGKGLRGEEDTVELAGEEWKGNASREKEKRVVVGWRMPYDLPLTPYGRGDEPWCATAKYGEPDVKGYVWDGF